MSQKLTELLNSISPLPWSSERPSITTEQQRAANKLYRAHSANFLPELVKAFFTVVSYHNMYSSGARGNCQCGTCKILKPALAAAEEIKDTPDALTTSEKNPTVTLP